MFPVAHCTTRCTRFASTVIVALLVCVGLREFA
jgi:hypothetical protein